MKRRVGLRGIRRGDARILEDAEVAAHLADDADLVAVLEVGADPGPLDANGDAVALELLMRPDARQHEELRAVEGAGGEDHLALGVDGFAHPFPHERHRLSKRTPSKHGEMAFDISVQAHAYRQTDGERACKSFSVHHAGACIPSRSWQRAAVRRPHDSMFEGR